MELNRIVERLNDYKWCAVIGQYERAEEDIEMCDFLIELVNGMMRREADAIG